ncbi:TetR/AcrR family transcriptional regulator [Aquimarina agarilytica]|uniref:TetR/AcrR family transcriptional regulator n=1 Tax=Aquimarina agarilytica TaxID=1087449 RepID=UPI0002891E41|nr:TetR/AcrR family transcriptional regulator [Aquimarina agarilytica]
MNLESKLHHQIIEKAAQLFLSRGFKSVTMDDLASEMAISKKTIYTHFSTKTDLVAKASEFTFNLILEGIINIRAQELDPIEELYVINDFVHENLKNEVSAPEYQLCKYYPDIFHELNQRKFEAVHDSIITNLKRGIERKSYRSDLPIEIVARLYFLNITGLCNQEIFPNETYNPNLINHAYLDYHIRGIATEKGINILTNIQKERNL